MGFAFERVYTRSPRESGASFRAGAEHSPWHRIFRTYHKEDRPDCCIDPFPVASCCSRGGGGSRARPEARDVSRATGIAKRLTAARLGVRPENAAKRSTITQDGRAEKWTTLRPSVYCFRVSVTWLGQNLGVSIRAAARQHPRYFSRLP